MNLFLETNRLASWFIVSLLDISRNANPCIEMNCTNNQNQSSPDPYPSTASNVVVLCYPIPLGIQYFRYTPQSSVLWMFLTLGRLLGHSTLLVLGSGMRQFRSLIGQPILHIEYISCEDWMMFLLLWSCAKSSFVLCVTLIKISACTVSQHEFDCQIGAGIDFLHCATVVLVHYQQDKATLCRTICGGRAFEGTFHFLQESRELSRPILGQALAAVAWFLL